MLTQTQAAHRQEAFLHRSPTAPDQAPAEGGKVKRERRRSQRIRTVFRVAKVVRDRVAGLWRVRNISDFGMMLRTHVQVSPGERLSIGLSENVAFDGKVVWQEGDCCGIEFEHPINSAKVLRSLVAEQRAPQYRPPRLGTDIHAAAYCENGIRPIRITDISQHGLGFTHDGCFKGGMKTLVMFENGLERRGVVRWATDDRAGLQLLEPFTCDELESIGTA